MKVKVFGGALLVIILLSSSVSATQTVGIYSVNPVSKFLNVLTFSFIEQFCVGCSSTNVDSWISTGNLLGGDADDYANGKMTDQEKEKLSLLGPKDNM